MASGKDLLHVMHFSRKIILAATRAAATFLPTAAIAPATLPYRRRPPAVAAIVAEGAVEATHVPVLGNVTVGRRYEGLTADQISCFQGMHNDLRAVGGQSAATAEAGDELLEALLNGSPMRWRLTVRSVKRLLADVPTGSASNARARLEAFIAENCDLLDGNQLEDRLFGRAGS